MGFLQDDLLAELDELEQETLDEQMLNIGTTAELPNVPQTELPKHERGFPNTNLLIYHR